MAKKQDLKLGGLMMGVTNRLTDAIEETKNTATVSTVDAPKADKEQVEEKTTVEQEPVIEEPISANEEAVASESNFEEKDSAFTLELAIDEDINTYTGITKPVSFALPKDIKRALDSFVDDYNDASPSKKTTQAKVVAQALRNFLVNYK